MNVSFIDLYAPPERDAPVSTQKDRPVMYGSIVITLNCSYEVLILESKSYDGDDVGGSVVTYIVALEHLLQEMDKASHIWAKIKSSALLNTREVLCQMTNISKHEECREVKEGQIRLMCLLISLVVTYRFKKNNIQQPSEYKQDSLQLYDFFYYNGWSVQQELEELMGRNVSYFPCQSHRSYTLIEHGCNASTLIPSLSTILESLYTFFAGSTKSSFIVKIRRQKLMYSAG
ncbi:unnamed protein product [Lepeophtheirus salmonis]|uniref:(salmon louse) hypothetical protein n=1 Tax=Lepeophtheirus salmonis TaxID=72036 RepID=A0A7R8CSW3_LEPSM|nr:unnamed protein product [Lepeophtheirus salmonis]CAF2920137.1 unnamed protein product [Lepeophtheirus salmonis]